MEASERIECDRDRSKVDQGGKKEIIISRNITKCLQMDWSDKSCAP